MAATNSTHIKNIYDDPIIIGFEGRNKNKVFIWMLVTGIFGILMLLIHQIILIMGDKDSLAYPSGIIFMVIITMLIGYFVVEIYLTPHPMNKNKRFRD